MVRIGLEVARALEVHRRDGEVEVEESWSIAKEYVL